MEVGTGQDDALPLRISVIVANYNYGSFLKDCLESVLGQNYSPVSLIVVDDGSTDTSREVLESFGSSIVCIYKSNGGQASCWNAGMERSLDSDIVVFLDSDDMLEPGILADYAQAFREADVVRCQGYLRIVGKDGQPTGLRYPTSAPDDLHCKSKMILSGPGSYVTVGTSGNAWRTSYMRQIYPLPEDLGKAADVLLFGTAPFFGITKTLPRFTAKYRVHGTSITDRKRNFDQASVTRAVDVYDRLCLWIESVSVSRGLQVKVDQWHGRDWRIATLRHLAFRSSAHPSTTSLSTHLKSVGTVQSHAKRSVLVVFILGVRFAPRPVAWLLAKRAIALHSMAG